MKTINTPPRSRNNSMVFSAISKLYVMGGRGTTKDLVSVMESGRRSASRFNLMIMPSLLKRGLAELIDQTIVITPAGRSYVETASAAYSAGAETHATNVRPLDLKKNYSFPERRPGAYDYRNIPSVMGNSRVLPNGESAE